MSLVGASQVGGQDVVSTSPANTASNTVQPRQLSFPHNLAGSPPRMKS